MTKIIGISSPPRKNSMTKTDHEKQNGSTEAAAIAHDRLAANSALAIVECLERGKWQWPNDQVNHTAPEEKL